MCKRNKKLACTLALLMVLNNIPASYIAHAKESEAIKSYSEQQVRSTSINVISQTSVRVEEAKNWAKKNNATETFIKLADLYWKYAPSTGVNPALAYVQSAIETGFGRFTGVLNESYFNPCGMKNTEAGANADDKDPNAHKKFDNWDHGVQAHLDHLALYAGATGYPKETIVQNYKVYPLEPKYTYDPRHFKYLSGTAKTAQEIGQKWASAGYGDSLVKYYNELGQSAEQGKVYQWKVVDNKKYYINQYGEKYKGWLQLDGKRYFLNLNTGEMETGWHQEPSNKWYYLNKEGIMVTSWLELPDGKYYIKSDGIMLTGWHEESNKKYYFDAYGRAVINKTVKIDGQDYSFDKDGVLQGKTGWYANDRYQWSYYIYGEMQKGWLTLSDGKYYICKL